MNNYCVYIHIFPNQKTYVGITKQQPEERWHKGKGYSLTGQPYVRHAIDKYGWENIQHNILEDNLTYNEALEKETYYIQKYHSYYLDNGYNMNYGGTISGNMLKPINQFSLSGEYINTYISITEASQITGIDGTDISQTILQHRKTAGNYQWKEYNEEDLSGISSINYTKNTGRKKVAQYKNGKLIKIYKSMLAAAKELHIDRAAISLVAKGLQKQTSDGSTWIFV